MTLSSIFNKANTIENKYNRLKDFDVLGRTSIVLKLLVLAIVRCAFDKDMYKTASFDVIK